MKRPRAYRDTASFGKRIEFWIVGEMLKQGLDVYIPLVDDRGVDAVVRRDDGSFAEVQIKARSKDVKANTVAQFNVRSHKPTDNHWFVFYSESLNKMWLMNSDEFITESREIPETGKLAGLKWIRLNSKRSKQYEATDFGRIKGISTRD